MRLNEHLLTEVAQEIERQTKQRLQGFVGTRFNSGTVASIEAAANDALDQALRTCRLERFARIVKAQAVASGPPYKVDVRYGLRPGLSREEAQEAWAFIDQLEGRPDPDVAG